MKRVTGGFVGMIITMGVFGICHVIVSMSTYLNDINDGSAPFLFMLIGAIAGSILPSSGVKSK